MLKSEKHSSVLQHFAVSAFICALFVFLFPAAHAGAEEIYRNDETGYVAVIEDDASLISHSDEYYEEITDKMAEITQYGNVALLTTFHNSGSEFDYASSRMHGLFGNDSATVFLIDMDNRKVCVYSYGKILKVVTTSKAYIITDNIYSYATLARFDECAFRAFEQEAVLLDGGRISQPMKYISSILLSLLFSGIIIYSWARDTSSASPVNTATLLKNTSYRLELKNLRIKNISVRRVSNSSSSSGGGHSGGGDGGGGGGGGSHSF